MSEHDDRQDHDAKADELERELDEMQERSEKLGDEIGGAGEDWERRKADESVPGATGEPSEGDERRARTTTTAPRTSSTSAARSPRTTAATPTPTPRRASYARGRPARRRCRAAGP